MPYDAGVNALTLVNRMTSPNPIDALGNTPCRTFNLELPRGLQDRESCLFFHM
ncbi:hypothetical protein [Burkholderia stagnalis]|uniref:hypothetical protein n=1 Tax=Burkholderia stagnalis TaxID=1503054 RepID=UPI000B299907|nr:hypothetical protein [Burkholderia stagnalis]